jgi:UDP-N-acetylglucosamine--N-acetylmuramyl-(pentapeptide) pyrophosphoryl-undecaprenol N-acetylglucosamine transferase
LGKNVNTICVAYEGLDKYFPKEKIKLTGNPIRKDLLEVKSKHIEGKDAFSLIHSKHTLLVLGGSLGARRINELIEANLDFFEELNVQVIWQCGKLYYNTYKQYNDLKHVQVHAFLNKMDLAYAAADVIISRAGAISVSELCIVGKPTIFIPSPNVAEDHQTKNAKAVADKNAAILIKENELEAEFQNQFSSLISNENQRKELSKNIESLALVNATKDIVDEVEKLLKP